MRGPMVLVALLLLAVGGTANPVIDEVRQPHHPEAGVEQPLQVAVFALEAVQPLDAQQRGRGSAPALSSRQVGLRVAPGLDDGEPAAGFVGDSVQDP